MSFVDWYYPQPVTTSDQADDEIQQIVDQAPVERRNDTSGGGTEMHETGVARTYGQGPDIDIGALSVVSANDVQFTDFNDYLNARGLPVREGFFSGTDFSSLGSQSNLPSAKTATGLATTVGGAMVGLAGGVFSPTREVMDPTGTSPRYIHESGIFNTIASMNIAEEFSDLGAIKDAYEKNPTAGSKQNGIIMHMNGRPIYRMPGSAYYKHKIPGLGEISQLQGQNLEKLALAPAAFDAFKAQLLRDDGGFEGKGTISPGDTFISTPNGGYNLDGSFNFGGQTSAAMGNMEDKVSLGNQMFDHVTDPNAKAQAAARTSYATAVLEGLRSLPSNATSAERTAVIQNVVNMSRNMTTPTSVLSKVITPSSVLSKDVAAVQAMQVQGPAGGKSYAVDYEGDYASGVEGGLSGEMSRDEQANEYSDTGNYGSGGDWDGDIMAQGGKIRGYAPGGEVSSDSDDAADDDMGDVATMDSSYSADPDSFSDEDAGMYDGGNDDSDDRGSDETKAAVNKDIRDNIVSALQNRSLTPDQRRQVNQLVQGSTPSIEELDAQKGFVSTPSTKSSGTDTFGNFLEDSANSALQAGFLQALGMAIGFNYGGTVKNSYAEGDMITGEQATQQGEPVLTANEVMEGTESGFIQAKPSQVSEAATVADDVDMRGDVGGEIINASAVVEAGEADIAKMIADARDYARQNGIELPESKEKSDIRVSKGEAYIEKELVPIIGRDKIRKINNRGKKDTRRKIKETQMAAEGGFIKKKFAEGDMITLYRGEPLDPSKVIATDYGYGKEDVGKFHTPDVKRAGRFAAGAGKGNQVIKSRKVTIDELFDGVTEAWKTQQKKKTEYSTKMTKSQLNSSLKFVEELKKDYVSGKRSLESMAMFLQEQVFHDDKSRINFIETFKNDPRSAGKLAGRAILKVATVATPPLAVLAGAAEMLTPSSLGKGTRYDDSFMSYQYTPNK